MKKNNISLLSEVPAFTAAQVSAELQNLAELDNLFDLRVEQESLTYAQRLSRRAHLERCMDVAEDTGDYSFLDPLE